MPSKAFRFGKQREHKSVAKPIRGIRITIPIHSLMTTDDEPENRGEPEMD